MDSLSFCCKSRLTEAYYSYYLASFAKIEKSEKCSLWDILKLNYTCRSIFISSIASWALIICYHYDKPHGFCLFRNNRQSPDITERRALVIRHSV